MRKYDLAIFDFDGTLADSLPRLLDILNRLSESYGFPPVAAAELDSLRAVELRHLLKRLQIPVWKLPALTLQIRRQMAHEADQITLFPGIDEFLRRMTSHGVRLAMVSSNSWETIQRILGPQLASLFLYQECSASIFGKRPKLRKVVRASGVDIAKAIYIGDEIRDLQAARAEHLAFGAVTWGYTPASHFEPHHPQELFESVSAMCDTLTGH